MNDATTAPTGQAITLPIAMFRDRRLSADARAVLALALTFTPESLPMPFMPYLREQRVGIGAAKRVMRELEACGYLRRGRLMHGRYSYDFRATPVELASLSTEDGGEGSDTIRRSRKNP